MDIYIKEWYLDLMFYTGTVGEGRLYHHSRSSFEDITALTISASPIYLDRIFPLGYKENFILRGVYSFTKNSLGRSFDLGRVPAQDGKFALILWYVAKSIFRS